MKHDYCVACGVTDGLEHHHLVTRGEGRKKRDDERNLITLCGRCHALLHERRVNGAYNVSQRTSAGLQAAKLRGVKLGNQAIADANREAAAERDAAMEPVLRELSGLSAHKTAAELKRRGFGTFSHMAVFRARERLGIPRSRRQA